MVYSSKSSRISKEPARNSEARWQLNRINTIASLQGMLVCLWVNDFYREQTVARAQSSDNTARQDVTEQPGLLLM